VDCEKSTPKPHLYTVEIELKPNLVVCLRTIARLLMSKTGGIGKLLPVAWEMPGTSKMLRKVPSFKVQLALTTAISKVLE
jgi:hypothetical protein